MIRLIRWISSIFSTASQLTRRSTVVSKSHTRTTAAPQMAESEQWQHSSRESTILEEDTTRRINLHHHQTCSPFLWIASPITVIFQVTQFLTFMLSSLHSRYVHSYTSSFHFFCGLHLFRLPSVVPSKIASMGRVLRVMCPNHSRGNYFDCSLDIIYSLTHFINSFLYVGAFISYQLSHTRHAK